jgi:hypothetical protein
MIVLRKAAIFFAALVLTLAGFSAITRMLSMQNLLLAGRPVVEVRVDIAG